MNKIKFVLFMAGLSLGLILTLSCGEVEPFEWESSISSSSFGENGGVSSIMDNSSSSAKPSSSAVASCLGFVDGTKREHYGMEKEQFCDSRDGKKYVYVKIGEQYWMAENLNYNASGSRCNEDSEANCTTYGRLYTWATAMDLPDNCNASNCDSQVSEEHRGICPDGWHIPSSIGNDGSSSSGDWKVLAKFVSPDCDVGICENYAKLKTKSGWDDSYNGTDDFMGFRL